VSSLRNAGVLATPACPSGPKGRFLIGLLTRRSITPSRATAARLGDPESRRTTRAADSQQLLWPLGLVHTNCEKDPEVGCCTQASVTCAGRQIPGIPVSGIFTNLNQKSCDAFWPNCVYSCGPVIASCSGCQGTLRARRIAPTTTRGRSTWRCARCTLSTSPAGPRGRK